jgi:hypothetical protein
LKYVNARIAVMSTRPQTTPATIPPMGAEEVDVEVGVAEGA